MFDDSKGFLSRAFLEREWALDYKAWRGGEAEAQLLVRLRAWAGRADLRERSTVPAFLQIFFAEMWGYEQSGRGGDYTAWPEYPVPGAGAGGGSGSADLALGWFGEPRAVPQVLCEFKDIRSSLDAPQARKGNTRSPVRQCLDYVAGVRREVFPNEPIQAWWGLVSDMNEFRLYWWDRPQQYLRFVLRSPQPLLEPSLIDDTEEARFDRFAFAKLFRRDQLLSRGGRPALLRLVDRQGEREKALEGEFYADYKGVRDKLFEALRAANPAFAGTLGQLLRLAQKILDRFIFVFYCEDMGERMLFPPQLIRDTLVERSRSPIFDPAGEELWALFRRLFRTMDTGGQFGQTRLRQAAVRGPSGNAACHLRRRLGAGRPAGGALRRRRAAPALGRRPNLAAHLPRRRAGRASRRLLALGAPERRRRARRLGVGEGSAQCAHRGGHARRAPIHRSSGARGRGRRRGGAGRAGEECTAFRPLRPFPGRTALDRAQLIRAEFFEAWNRSGAGAGTGDEAGRAVRRFRPDPARACPCAVARTGAREHPSASGEDAGRRPLGAGDALARLGARFADRKLQRYGQPSGC